MVATAAETPPATDLRRHVGVDHLLVHTGDVDRVRNAEEPSGLRFGAGAVAWLCVFGVPDHARCEWSNRCAQRFFPVGRARVPAHNSHPAYNGVQFPLAGDGVFERHLPAHLRRSHRHCSGTGVQGFSSVLRCGGCCAACLPGFGHRPRRPGHARRGAHPSAQASPRDPVGVPGLAVSGVLVRIRCHSGAFLRPHFASFRCRSPGGGETRGRLPERVFPAQ